MAFICFTKKFVFIIIFTIHEVFFNFLLDSDGNQRDIWVRFVRDHPVENNDWGDFQTFRRLYGLITVGKFNTQVELNELCRIHESLKVSKTSSYQFTIKKS